MRAMNFLKGGMWMLCNIEAERARNRLTREDLARELGISKQAVSNKIYGRSPVKPPEVRCLCDMFGMEYNEQSASYLLEDR